MCLSSAVSERGRMMPMKCAAGGRHLGVAPDADPVGLEQVEGFAPVAFVGVAHGPFSSASARAAATLAPSAFPLSSAIRIPMR